MDKFIAAATLGALLAGGFASAAEPGAVGARVVGASKQALKDVPVVVRVKAWPGGTFQVRDHDASTDSKGRVSIAGAIPAGTRYGVWASAVAPGWTLASHYHWAGTPVPMDPVDLVVAPAHPLRLRFLDDEGQPVAGVRAYPSMRATAEGVRHVVATGARDAIVRTSEADGMLAMPYFLAGEWVAVEVAFPGAEWEPRHLRVPSAKDPVVDVPRKAPSTPERELEAGSDPKKRFFLSGPKAGDVEPAEGYGLVLVLPGGDGGDGFRSWVRERYDAWVDAGWVWAQLVAPVWDPAQKVVWPTVEEPARRAHLLDGGVRRGRGGGVCQAREARSPARARAGWSSSGPALYRSLSLKASPVTGFLIAMSVFHTDDLEPLANAKGRPVFLLHAPDDATCPLRLAEKARDTLKKQGLQVEWATYEGGHGWEGESEDHARRGLAWLARHLK